MAKRIVFTHGRANGQSMCCRESLAETHMVQSGGHHQLGAELPVLHFVSVTYPAIITGRRRVTDWQENAKARRINK